MRVVRIHSDEGSFTAVLGKPGRIYTPYVCLADYPVRKRRMANGDVAKYASELTLKGKPYPLKRAVRAMLRVGRQYGITGGAKALLKEARK
jgi:hypothetical protein